MAVKLCEACGMPIKKLKHSILCECGPKIVSWKYLKAKK